uniref:Uncharacterized protein n=1 Tax=Acrobeloides nanus TaxID=290746 RepID=A0A914CGA7_9BILA
MQLHTLYFILLVGFAQLNNDRRVLGIANGGGGIADGGGRGNRYRGGDGDDVAVGGEGRDGWEGRTN